MHVISHLSSVVMLLMGESACRMKAKRSFVLNRLYSPQIPRFAHKGWPLTNMRVAGQKRRPLKAPRAGAWRALVDSWLVALRGFPRSRLLADGRLVGD
jgi:hypothetical protein